VNKDRKVSLSDLPEKVQNVCVVLLQELQNILGEKLYGLYLYGAMVFPETKTIQDIDFHVILTKPLTKNESHGIQTFHESMAKRFPPLGAELDGYYILLKDAQNFSVPRHQVYSGISDNSWALHRAHMRAGYCIVMHGPDPIAIFPEPSWDELVEGLESEQTYIENHLDMYPDYCVLNLCRLMKSYETGNVVVSKFSSAGWARDRFPQWEKLITKALNQYEVARTDTELCKIRSEIRTFYNFTCETIVESKTKRL